MFAAVTMADYTSMLNENNEIDKLPGKLRRPGNWEQFIMVPTTEEAIQRLAYHQSMSHTMSSEETIVLAIAFDAHNTVHHMSQILKMLTSFQRGYSVQVLQVHAPYDYVFTEAEKNNLRAMYLNYNAANKFDKYNWSNGWIRNYGHTMHVRSTHVNADHFRRFAAPHNLWNGFGSSWTIWPISAQLPPDVQLALGVYKADKKIDATMLQFQRGTSEDILSIAPTSRSATGQLSRRNLRTREKKRGQNVPDNPLRPQTIWWTTWRARTMVRQAADSQL